MLSWSISNSIVSYYQKFAVEGRGNWWIYGKKIVFNIHNAISGFNFTTFIVAFLGAFIVLYIVKLLKLR